MSAPEARVLEHALASAGAVAARLRASIARLAPLVPLTAEALGALSEGQAESVDAFLKRFEQLEDLLARQVFKAIAILEGEEVASMSARDLAHVMDKLGILDSGPWLRAHLTRNRLAHVYSREPERQCEVINAVYDLAPQLLAVLDRAKKRVRERGLLSGGGE